MARFVAGPKLWAEIQARSKTSRSLLACVGYVGRNPVAVMKWRKGDTLIADISYDTVSRGLCSARGALKLLKKGVRIYQSPCLHAKVYLFDSSAVVCSANASETSLNVRREAGVVLTGKDVASVKSWVGAVLALPDTVRLDGAVLMALAKMEPKNIGASRRGPVRKAVGLLGSSEAVWLMAAEDAEDETKAERLAAKAYAARIAEDGAVSAESDVEWFREVDWKVFHSVKPGDVVVLGRDPVPYYPHGSLEGPYRCIAPVDLGSRCGSRRYRLALADVRARNRKVAEGDFKKLKVAFGMSPVPGWPSMRKARGKTVTLMSRMLGA